MAGFGFGRGNVGIHGYLNGTLLRNGYELTGRYSAQEEFRISFGNSVNDFAYIHEYAVLIGKNITRHPISHFVLSTGISLVKVTTRSRSTLIPNNNNSTSYYSLPDYNYESIHQRTIGIPVEIKYFNNFFRYIPINTSFGTNINSKKCFYYLTMGLQFGNTRERRIKKSNN